MKILYVASEARPFVKTGGLGDVMGALPKTVASMKNDCRVIIPLYEEIPQEYRQTMRFVGSTYVDLSWRRQYLGVFEYTVDNVVYYFIDNEYYFKRKGLYGHFDDGERFAFFSKAVLEACSVTGFYPDVIHANDWHTALVPVFLDIFYRNVEGLRNTKTVFTIHNIEFQGKYDKYLDGATNKKISKRLGISQSTVERVIHERFEIKVKEQLSYECPPIIGIDEHTIHKGYKFATTIADLTHHRVYDVIEGKSRNLVESKLMSYKGRDSVKVVCMDLSSNYRSIVRRCFPKAKIVADRFHVIRLVLYHFMEFCKQAQEEVKWNRKLTYPLRKRGDRLNSEELERLKKFFENNPAIKLAYEFKERLCELLNRKHQTAKECMRNIKELKTMMKQMKYEAPKEFERLAETISDWFAPIIRMWRFTKNNGITEGFHRKMKLIQRMAYGYKNFEFKRSANEILP